MELKKVKSELKNLGISVKAKTKSRVIEVAVNTESFAQVAKNINDLKQQGFEIKLFGVCHENNLNPEHPLDMKECSSCYLTIGRFV